MQTEQVPFHGHLQAIAEAIEAQPQEVAAAAIGRFGDDVHRQVDVVGQPIAGLQAHHAGLAGQGATGLVGGGILTAIAGIIKSSMAKA